MYLYFSISISSYDAEWKIMFNAPILCFYVGRLFNFLHNIFNSTTLELN